MTSDAPFFPPDLVMRLARELPSVLGCSFAAANGMRHPVFALWRISAFGRLQAVYDTGMRSLMAAQDQIGAAAVTFTAGAGPGDDMFFNINRQDDQSLAQLWLQRRAS